MTIRGGAVRHELVTDLLDVVGLLAVAVGLAAAAAVVIGWAAVAVGGVVVLAGSAFASWRVRPRRPGTVR